MQGKKFKIKDLRDSTQNIVFIPDKSRLLQPYSIFICHLMRIFNNSTYGTTKNRITNKTYIFRIFLFYNFWVINCLLAYQINIFYYEKNTP